jgi:hypothetical protein
MSFPTLVGESVEIALQFALLLRDGFADSDELQGDVVVTAGAIQGKQKYATGAFLFYHLKPGMQSLSVSSGSATPYYLPTDMAVTIPAPPAPPPVPTLLWPAFPDIRLADPDLPLGDPGQKPAYTAQRQTATLLPTTAYPFPAGTTLIRGWVTHAGGELGNATVRQVGSKDPSYTTRDDGQFVLYWKDAPGIPQKVTINARHANMADANVDVTVLRGLTVSVTIDM